MPKMTKEELQARLLVAKLHQWLGLEVLEADERRVSRVRIRRIPAEAAEADAAPELTLTNKTDAG